MLLYANLQLNMNRVPTGEKCCNCEAIIELHLGVTYLEGKINYYNL